MAPARVRGRDAGALVNVVCGIVIACTQHLSSWGLVLSAGGFGWSRAGVLRVSRCLAPAGARLEVSRLVSVRGV